MFERRWRYGLTFLHVAAQAAIWTCVYAYASVVGDLEDADVAVARVWRIWRGLRRHGGTTGYFCCARVLRIFCEEIARKHDKTECCRVRRSEARWGRSRAVLRRMRETHPDCFTRHAGTQGAAADLEGFAHSAAAEGEKSSGQEEDEVRLR